MRLFKLQRFVASMAGTGGKRMNFFSILAAVGLLALAGLCGYVLAWLEKKAMEEKEGKR